MLFWWFVGAKRFTTQYPGRKSQSPEFKTFLKYVSEYVSKPCCFFLFKFVLGCDSGHWFQNIPGEKVVKVCEGAEKSENAEIGKNQQAKKTTKIKFFQLLQFIWPTRSSELAKKIRKIDAKFSSDFSIFLLKNENKMHKKFSIFFLNVAQTF